MSEATDRSRHGRFLRVLEMAGRGRAVGGNLQRRRALRQQGIGGQHLDSARSEVEFQCGMESDVERRKSRAEEWCCFHG